MNSENHNFNRPVLLRLRDVAGRLQVSRRTIYREVAAGKLKLVHVRGCSCIEEAELQRHRRQQGGEP